MSTINVPVPMSVSVGMTSGATILKTDKVPYLSRVSEAGASDVAFDKIIGGTIAWNQLCNGSSTSVPNGHKYVAYIGGLWSVGASNGTAITTDASTDKIYDITQMFGSVIADYIYSIEQSTANAGVAWFRSLFPKDYYEYNAGELISVNTSAHIMKDASENIVGSYQLDSSIILRGIPKLDANNNLYYDGDTYESDGTVTRRYGIVDLGTLTWSKYSVTQGTLFRSNEIVGAKIITGFALPNIICSKYVTALAGNRAEMTISCSVASKVDIIDSTYADLTAAQFKAAMSGVYLLYELATQTTDPADPYENPQAVYADGLEEYVDERDVPIPVGHETKYVARQTTETAFDAYPMTVTQGVEV